MDHSAFDLVHQRFGFATFSSDFSALATKRLVNLVRPGGYIQLVDGDYLAFDHEGHPAFARLMDFHRQGDSTMRDEPVSGEKFEEMVERCGRY